MRTETAIFLVAAMAANVQGGGFVYTNTVPWSRLAYVKTQTGGSSEDYNMTATPDGLRVDALRFKNAGEN
jgi:hypothetical protein